MTTQPPAAPTSKALAAVKVSRVIKAPRARVFNAWKDPEVFAQWWLNDKDEPPMALALDARKAGEFVFEFQAHRREVTSLSCSVGARGLLATGSTDTKVKLWDVSGARGGGAEQLASQDMRVGAIFSSEFSRDEPFCISAGGAKGGVVVWDARASKALCERFGI